MTKKERALLAGCLGGERASWDTLVLQYSRLAYSTIRSTLAVHHALPQDDIVEDLHQEFFLRLCDNDFRKLRGFRGDRGCSLATWLRLIAARLTIDWLRKRQTTVVEVTDGLAQDERNPDDSLAISEQVKLLAEAIQMLPPRDRLIIDLSYRKGIGVEEIAAILRTSVGAVYTQRSRVLDKIREILKISTER